jgi:hypothetical protein
MFVILSGAKNPRISFLPLHLLLSIFLNYKAKSAQIGSRSTVLVTNPRD